MSDNTRRSAADQAALDAALRDLFENKITFNQHLGFRVQSMNADEVLIGFDMRSELVGHFLHGRLHGGVISSVLDATGGLAVMKSITEQHPDKAPLQVMQLFKTLGTVDLRIDYLRQGIGRHFVASAKTLRLGKRIGHAQMSLHNDEQVLVATGVANYIL